jgi:hypothetical protein
MTMREAANMSMCIESGPWARSVAVLVLVAGLSGCSWLGFGRQEQNPVPRKPGLYALYEGDLQRLDGDRDWEMKTWDERSNLSPEVEFVIRHPQLPASRDELERAIHLSRAAWVRSEISAEGDILPVDGNQWVAADVDEQRVPVTLEPYVDHSEVVRIVPDPKLQGGLYSLQLRTADAQLSARAGVGWAAVDKRVYSAANCVDHYLGDAIRYRPCAQQEHAFASKWLQVHLVEPEVREITSRQKQLIVSGVVINTSRRPRRVPTLEAQLRSSRGEVIERWQFEAATAELQPGASARFRSSLPDPPAGVSNVHVTFAAPGASLAGPASL